MRIACVYLPTFSLQVAVRGAPHRMGRAFAVVDAGTVIASSRAARGLGVRVGMSAARARELGDRASLGGLQLESHDHTACAAALAALAEAMLQCSKLVDVGADDTRGHKALFVEVPTHSRGATFGERLIATAGRQGLRARVGIADDRFAAWCAAAVPHRTASDDDPQASLFVQTCTTVPRGGSAAFLAPLPLAMLPMDDDVRRLLEHRGVRTVGDFAALPPPTVGRRWSDAPVDPHDLARGDGPTALVRFQPRGAVRETVELEIPLHAVEPIAFMLHPVVDRVCERLRGRDRAASGLAVELASSADRARTALRIALPTPTASSRAVLDAVRSQLIAARLDHAIDRVTLEVAAEAEPEADELELFAPRIHRRTRRGNRRRRPPRQAKLPLALD